MSDWALVPFGKICEDSAFGPRFSGDLYAPNGNVATLRTTDISADGRIEYQQMPLAELDLSKFTRHVLRRDDLVITRTGRVGTTAVFDRFGLPVLPGAFLIRFRLDRTKAEPRFYRYYFNSAEGQSLIQSVATGSVQQNLNITNLHTLRLPLPPLSEQRAIAGVLGALDDKIEQNRGTSAALERLARAMFRAWFVGFEPVKAKAAGADAFPSMPQAVFDSLSTRLVDSELGPVPEGWEVKPLAHIAKFLNGLALQKYPPRGDGLDLPVIKIAELRKGSAAGADMANGDLPQQFVIDDRDLLFSWSGTLEVEFWFGGKGALNQHLFKVSSAHYPDWFCLYWIRQHLPSFRVIASSKATTMGHIKRGHLEEALVAVPPTSVINAAHAMIGAAFDLHANLQIESRKLALLRDYLLPRLLSGEVHVAVPEVSRGD